MEDVDEKLALVKVDYYEIIRQYFFPDGSEATFLGGFKNPQLQLIDFHLLILHHPIVLSRNHTITYA